MGIENRRAYDGLENYLFGVSGKNSLGYSRLLGLGKKILKWSKYIEVVVCAVRTWFF